MKSQFLAATLIGVATVALLTPAGAAMLPLTSQAVEATDGLVINTRVARRTTVVRGPRGGTAVRRSTVVGGREVVSRAAGLSSEDGRGLGIGGAPGGAIAAGAAIGVLAAGAAVAFAGQPPAPGLCWYYTDPNRTQGFWDQCKRIRG